MFSLKGIFCQISQKGNKYVGYCCKLILLSWTFKIAQSGLTGSNPHFLLFALGNSWWVLGELFDKSNFMLKGSRSCKFGNSKECRSTTVWPGVGIKSCPIWAVVVAQLAEQFLRTPEFRGSNQVKSATFIEQIFPVNCL